MDYTKEKISAEEINNSYFNKEGPKTSGLFMITTKTCTKCKAILARDDDLASLLCGKKIHVYEFNGEEEGIEVLADMGFSSAPIFLSINDEFTKKVFKMGSDFTSFIDFIGSLDSVLDN